MKTDSIVEPDNRFFQILNYIYTVTKWHSVISCSSYDCNNDFL